MITVHLLGVVPGGRALQPPDITGGVDAITPRPLVGVAGGRATALARSTNLESGESVIWYRELSMQNRGTPPYLGSGDQSRCV